MDKDMENQEELPNGIDQVEETEEEEVEVDKEFGVLLFANLNGGGYELRPIPVESGKVLRQATVNDVISLIGAVHANHLGAIAANKVMEILKQNERKIIKPKSPGIFARGR